MYDLSLQIQSSALEGFEDLVNELGGNAIRLAKAVGLNLVDLKIAQDRIPIDIFIKLIEKTSIELNAKTFGMVLGSRQAFYAIGHLGTLIQSCESVRQAIAVAISFGTYHNQGEIWQLETHGHVSILRRIDLYHDLADTRQYKELAMAVCLKLCRILLGNKLDGVTVELPHQQISRLADYSVSYGVPVKFNSENEAIVFPSGYLDVRIDSANSILKQSLEQEIKKEQQDQGTSYTARSQQIIEQTLGWQEASIEVVANSLNMHPRTLQRRLAEEGAMFKHLLTDIRVKTACSYLACSEVDITLLAARLGYREVGNFSRVFKRELGLSPREWRRSFGAF